jgi:hypothetical protein
VPAQIHLVSRILSQSPLHDTCHKRGERREERLESGERGGDPWRGSRAVLLLPYLGHVESRAAATLLLHLQRREERGESEEAREERGERGEGERVWESYNRTLAFLP